ncbi:MAG: LamG domain-containing protein, partial [Bacilli bacterium]
ANNGFLKNIILTNEWRRYSYTVTIPSGNQNTGLAGLFAGNHNSTYYVWNAQIEEKGYITPFVDGTREGIIKDYSNNGNNAILNFNYTPKWIGNSTSGNGSYEFNGASNYFTIPNNGSLNNNVFTISTWLKPNALPASTHQRVIANNYINGYMLNIYGSRIEAYVGTNHVTGPYLTIGKWSNIVITLDGSRLKLYFDGKLYSDISYTGTLSYNTNPINIGHDGTSYFKGSLDEIKMYSRALSANEIEQNYKADTLIAR